MLAGISEGKCLLSNFSQGEDCRATLNCLAALGVSVKRAGDAVKIGGRRHLRKPGRSLDAMNSGTTMRCLSGILAAQPFESRIIGDASLSRRPMDRVIEPLSRMGATLRARKGRYAPLVIRGGELTPLDYTAPLASAQVKTSVLLAALYADGLSTYREPLATRDHTERMLVHLGLNLKKSNGLIQLRGPQGIPPFSITVPGDISSAAFFIAAASALPGSRLLVKNVGLNPGRLGFLRVLRRMGARIETFSERIRFGEPIGSLRIAGARLAGARIFPEEIPALIDEIPILAVIATQAKGKTEISGAADLRVKESDRLHLLADGLRNLGARIREKRDGLVIHGSAALSGGAVDSAGDHRLAMAFRMGSLFATGSVRIRGEDSVRISYPEFHEHLREILAQETYYRD